MHDGPRLVVDALLALTAVLEPDFNLPHRSIHLTAQPLELSDRREFMQKVDGLHLAPSLIGEGPARLRGRFAVAAVLTLCRVAFFALGAIARRGARCFVALHCLCSCNWLQVSPLFVLYKRVLSSRSNVIGSLPSIIVRPLELRDLNAVIYDNLSPVEVVEYQLISVIGDR